MNVAEAARLLDLPPTATPEQVRARYLERRSQWEEKAAAALTPKLQEEYRAALARTTEAYETLVMAADGLVSTPPSPPPPVSASVWGALARGLMKALLAVTVGSIFCFAFDLAATANGLLPPDGEVHAFAMLGIWFAVAAVPALAWWIRTVRRRGRRGPDRLNRYAYLACLLVGGVSMWYSHVAGVEAERASEWLGRALEAKSARQWREAVRDAGIARGLKPGDAFYVNLHAEIQRGWIDDLKARLSVMPAARAYAALTTDPERAGLWIEEPAKAEYRQFFAATRQRAEEESRAVLRPIRGLIEQGELPQARAALMKLRPFPPGIPEYPAAMAELERADVGAQLAPAIGLAAQGDFAAAYAAFEQFKPASASARDAYTELLIAVHRDEIKALRRHTQDLIDQEAYELARDSCVDLREAIDRMMQVPDFAATEARTGGPRPALVLEEAQTAWRMALIRHTVEVLAQSLAANDAALAQGAIDEFAAVTQQPTMVTGQTLVSAGDVPALLSQVSHLGLGLPGTAGVRLRPELVLLEVAAPRLKSAAQVRVELISGYRSWAQRLLEQGMPGLALFALHEATRLGDRGGAELAQAARQRFIADRALTIDVESAGVRPSAETLALRRAVAEQITAAVPALITLREMRPGEEPEAGDLVLNPDYRSLTRERGQNEMRRDGRVQTNYHFNYRSGLGVSLALGGAGTEPVRLADWTATLRYSTWQESGDTVGHAPTFVDAAVIGAQLTRDLQDKVAAQAPAWLLRFAAGVEELGDRRGREQQGGDWLAGDWRCGWRDVWAAAGVTLPEPDAAAAARADLGIPIPAGNNDDEPALSPPPTGWQLENSLGMRFVALAKSPVLMSIWETRVRDFRTFVSTAGYRIDQGMVVLTKSGWQASADTWQHPGFEVTSDHPASGVSWDDARAFCAWLTEKEHRLGSLPPNYEYRLPTEQEWSEAAGAAPNPAAGAWPGAGAGNLAGWEAADESWPAQFSTVIDYADGFPRTAPVGWFSSTPLGVFDLEGNVAEWCSDPAESGRPEGERVVRGTMFASAPPRVNRFTCDRGLRHAAIGFRIVMAPLAAP